MRLYGSKIIGYMAGQVPFNLVSVLSCYNLLFQHYLSLVLWSFGLAYLSFPFALFLSSTLMVFANTYEGQVNFDQKMVLPGTETLKKCASLGLAVIQNSQF